jgi:hypothetical protein
MPASRCTHHSLAKVGTYYAACRAGQFRHCKRMLANAASNFKYMIAGAYVHQGELLGKALLHAWKIENVF